MTRKKGSALVPIIVAALMLGSLFYGCIGHANAALEPPIGPTLASDTNISPIGEEQGAPNMRAIASDGSRYLAVYRSAVAPYTCYGQFINPDGSLAGNRFTITDFFASCSIAYAGGNYLVVYDGNTYVYARVITAAGVVGPQITIADGSRSSVASNGNEFLLLWNQAEGAGTWRVRGLVLNSAGTPSARGAFDITPPGGPYRSNAHATYGGGKYLVTYEYQETDINGQRDVYGTLISASFTDSPSVGLQIPIAVGPAQQLNPRAAWDGTDFLIAWNDYLGGRIPYYVNSNALVYAARLSPDGTLHEGPSGGWIEIGPAFSNGVDVAFDGTNWLVVYVSGMIGGFTCGTRVSPSGAVLDPAWNTLQLKSARQCQFPLVAFDQDKTHALTAWRFVDTAGKSTFYAQIIGTVTTPPYEPPVAKAGPDQSSSVGTLVTLDGSQSTDTQYDWIFQKRPEGSTVQLNSPWVAKPTFKPDKEGEYVFTLTVYRGTGSSSLVSQPDTVKVTVGPSNNQAPIANAGTDQTVVVNTMATLDGSGSSDPDNNLPLSYTWSVTGRPTGSTATLSSTTVAKPTFTPDKTGEYQFSLLVKDSLGLQSQTAATVKLTANPPANQAPIANAGTDQTVNFGATVTLDGTASRDPDNNVPLTYAWSITGRPTGSTVQLSSSSVDKPTFAPDKQGVYTIQLVVKDSLNAVSTADEVKVTVNSPPTADPGADRSVNVGATVNLDGTKSSDPEGNFPLTYAWSITSRPPGSSATLSDAAASAPTFVADKLGDYEVQLVVIDSLGAQSAPIKVKITATNQAPTADAGADQTVDTGAQVTLDATASHDPDNNVPLTYAWSLTSKPDGSSAQLSSSTDDKPTFTPDKAGRYAFTLEVTDNLGLKSTTPDTVTVTANNRAPTADAGPDQAVNLGAAVTLDGTASHDPDDNMPLTYEWSITSRPTGSSAQLSSTSVAKPTFTPDTPGQYTIQLTVKDSLGAQSSSYEVKVTVNSPPTADAGADRTVNVGSSVALDGTGSSDPEGNFPLTYAWSITAAPPSSTATLSDPAGSKPTFIPDKVGDYEVQLVVIDSLGAQSASIKVKITATNQAPIADAGANQAGIVGTLVTLDGSNSRDPDNNVPLIFAWSILSKPDGSNAQLSSPTDDKPTLIADVSGDYIVQLVVKDSLGLQSQPSTVKVSANSRPIANAGPDQAVNLGTAAALDGMRSNDPDSNLPLSYSWTVTSRPDGSSAQLSGTATDKPGFTPDRAGEYVFTLVVTDSVGAASEPATTKLAVNTPPTVEAGPDQSSAHIGGPVSLKATASDADGNSLSYIWTLISKPDSSNPTLTGGSTVEPQLTPDKLGTYQLEVTVLDGKGGSASDTVSVAVVNEPPTADAGDPQSIHVGKLVALDGTGSSDPEGQKLSYSWSLTERPSGSTAALTDADTATPQFTPDVPGDYVVALTVTDTEGAASTASVKISTTNTPPIADAGLDKPVRLIGSTVSLDGSKSYDNDGDPMGYAWTLTEKPAGSAATLNDADLATPSFVADVHGTYVVRLVVSDRWASSVPDDIIVSFENLKPVVNAGTGQVGVVGQKVTLSGSGTDANGDPLTYSWTWSSVPDGSTTQLSATTSATPTFVPDKPGTYVAQLIVNDGFENSDASTVQIEVVTQATKITNDVKAVQGTISSSTISGAVKNPTMPKALTNKLNAVIESISSGDRQAALDQLNELLAKTDGCRNGGTPDKNDWVTTCSAQSAIYDQIANIIKEVQQV